MKLKPFLTGLMAAAAFGAAGYGLYLAGMDAGMNRGLGMAAVPVAATPAGDAAPPTAGLGAVPQSIAQGKADRGLIVGKEDLEHRATLCPFTDELPAEP